MGGAGRGKETGKRQGIGDGKGGDGIETERWEGRKEERDRA